MKIPVFEAQSRASTEAPGRSIQARMNAQTFVNAELQKGEVIGAFAESAQKYVETRYKVMIENRLNESLLGADEALRTRADELAKSADYTRALDGDDPIWTRDTQEVRERLLDNIGGDVYARSQFDARFGQLEAQNRLRLRNEIDSRVQAAAAASFSLSMRQLEEDVANTTDITVADLAARTAAVAVARGATAGGINPTRAEAARSEAIRRGLARATTNLASQSNAPINFVDGVRKALATKDPSNLDSSGLYLYGSMQDLRPEEQAEILSGSYRTVNFMFAETQEEEMQRRIAEQTATQAGDQADAYISDLSSGNPVNPASIEALANQFAGISSVLPPEKAMQVSEKIQSMQYISGIANTLNAVADPAYVRNLANTLQSNGIKGEGAEGVDTSLERATRDFVSNYATRMEETIVKDPISWARSTGAVNVGTVDVSAGAISAEFSQEQPGATGLAQRVLDAERVAARYNQPVRKVFGEKDATQIVSQIDPQNFEAALGQVETIVGNLGKYSDIGVQELEEAGLAPELVQAMYTSNPTVQRELVQISGVETADLRAGISVSTMPNDIETELNTQLVDYFAAFEAGGGSQAVKMANTQREVAQRLAFSRARTSTDSASNIAKKVISDIFPPVENWVRQPNQLFIVPRGANSNDVQVVAEEMMSEAMLREANIAPLDNPIFPEYVDLELNIASLSSMGVWLNNSTGDGLILHYDFDGQYLPAIKADGQPYQLLFRDASARAEEDRQIIETETSQGMSIAP
jgi:hypothetical protein